MGLKPNYMRLDNGALSLFQDLLNDKSINYQLNPLGMHLLNSEERDTSTFKDHFISGICFTDPDYSMKIGTKYFINRSSPLKNYAP